MISDDELNALRYRDAFASFAALIEFRDTHEFGYMARTATPFLDAGGITIQFHGFALTLQRDGKYFITDTSGG
jgi:hypothetical protein